MLTAAQVATMLGISSEQVMALVKRKEIAFYKFGRNTVRFELVDVADYQRDHPKPKPEGPKWTPRELRGYVRLWRRGGSTPEYAPTPEQVAIADGRYRRQRQAPWADGKAIRALYEEARRLSQETGIPHEVDHVIPLLGNFVSGLHVETNLRVIPKVDNHKKLNRYEIE